MFATRDPLSDQDRRNLATGETAIDVERRVIDPMLAAQLLRTKPSLGLLQNANDLFFAETAYFHRLSRQVENRLASNRGLLRGAGQGHSMEIK